MNQQMHQIGYVANAVGLSLRTVRYYEEVGLVPPSERTEGGFRLYTDDDIARLELIKQLKPLDFTLDELRDLLEAYDAATVARVSGRRRQAAAERLAGYVAVARQRCESLREQLAGVEAVTERLSAHVEPSRTGRRG